MDEYSSIKKKQNARIRDQFTDLVLSMSLEEVFDDNLYKYQVEKIPNSFQSVDEYLGSYTYPLLEETRAELSSALGAVFKAPFALVTSLTEANLDETVYNLKVDYWRNDVSDRNKEPYKTVPGDVVILSNVKPESDRDLQRCDLRCVFASIKSVAEGLDDCTTTSFKVKTADHIEIEDLLRKSLYVVFLTNITTNKRIWKVLKMRRNLKIIESVLSRNTLDEESCDSCLSKCSKWTDVEFDSTLLTNLNESQQEAIMSSLDSFRCNHKPSVQLIWGPPGTGKTNTLSVLLYILMRAGIRTLVCAPTNVAVTELASRVVKLVRDSVVCEIGKDCLSCPLGDILIFGNKDRMKIGFDIEQTFMDFRADSLCSIVCWRQRVTSMITFLRDCVSEHFIYMEKEKEKSNTKSLLEFVRGKFKHNASALRKCMLTIITHVPRRLVLEENFQRILQLCSFLDSVEILLFQETITCKSIKIIFSHDEVVSGPCVDLTSLSQLRIQCLSVLQTLHVSLKKVEFPCFTSTSSIEEFCFQNASVVFCTTSSAFKLHRMKTEPFSLLVIDEAAQLKECESVIALQIPYVTHAILAGDEKQLPTTVTSMVNQMVSEEAGFGRSLFERLSSLGHFKHLLSVQYRMHPSISRFPNSTFYQNRILDASSVQVSSYERCYLEGRIFGPYSFIDIVGGVEQLDDFGRSRRNMVEVAIAVKLVQKLFKAWIAGSKEKISIGVISPYAAQVMAIQGKVKNYENQEGFEIKVKSVDGFQGGEMDIIIISTVRANKGGSIGFLSSPQRTNVALTRARHCLWVLGNAKTLSNSDSVWEELVLDAKRRGCFFTVDEDSDMAKARTNVKTELDQLDNMLSSDSVLFKNARWRVMFSENFRKSFRTLTPNYVKKSTMNLLLKIASGWRPKKIDVDTLLNVSSHVVKKFKVETYHVICSVDIIKEDSVYKQVLKVWDIYPAGQNPKLLDRLDNIFAMYTDKFTNLCKEKCLEGNLEVPKTWSTEVDIVRFTGSETDNHGSVDMVDSVNPVENSKVSESLLLMKFYSLSSCIANHLLSDVEGEEVDLPFEVTDEEREIVMFPRSSFILGRSGTGKTTVLTMKLYRTLQQHFIASGNSMEADEIQMDRNLRQIFVSVSPKLCHAVKAHVSHLKRFASGDFSSSTMEMDNLDEMIEFKDIPDSLIGIQPEKYPLIITFHKFLMMLDGTLGDSYFKRFSDLRDSSQSVAVQTFIRKKEVTFDRFRSLYSPHFNAKVAKNFDPSRVYTEIMSHIKGGLVDGEASDMKLRRQEYVSLSNKRVSTLNFENREMIYDIFEHYEKMKVQRHEFDLQDLVIDIHHRLKNENLVGEKMDFVYIDEVQDLTMRQIALFRHICDNVDEGFVFSGDTAQTIARGVDFRFEDIRSLFYNEFLMKAKNSKSGGRIEKGHMSEIFCLSQNFRTHTGVLRLAKSVIDLICNFFPHSIDLLAPETSLIYGESPVLLEPESDQNSIVTIFGHGGKSDRNWVGFGAEQVILVRDDSARDEILKYIGREAIILTIVECKGLEFQDVLLYNFFGSSPVSNQWRVVYEFLNEKHLLDKKCPEPFPSFNQSKHNILCSELKQLYVAITRTKQRLWICEKDVQISKPMFDYWRRLSLVQVRKVDDSVAQAMHRSSTPEEWKSQGIKLFWEQNYEMATMCFEKAGEQMWEKRAKASGLRAASDRLRDSNPYEANIMLTEAAELFDSIDRVDSAVECFCDSGQYERAGTVYHRINDLKKAGECFMLAQSYEHAAEVYSEGRYFTECLSACTKGKYFDMGLIYIDNWRQQGIQEINIIGQDFLENCAHDFYWAKDNASMLNFVRAFYTLESKRHFLKSLDCLEELLILEEESGNFTEAADIAKTMGDIPLEASLLGKAGNYTEASSLLISYVLSNSLWVSGGKGWPLKTFPGKEKILSEAILYSEKVSGRFHAMICKEADVMSHGQMSLSELAQNHIASRECGSLIGEILSMMKFLDVHLQVNAKKYEWEYDLLQEGISQNPVSVMNLFSAWNSHKEHTLTILRCLDSIEKQDYESCKAIAGFCFDYFGTRVLESAIEPTLCLVNPNTEWTKNVEERFICRNRNVVSVKACPFVTMARKFWRQELVSVGLKVLEALQAVYRLKTLQNYGHGTCLILIFNVAKFFIHESNSFDMKKGDFRRFQDFMQLSLNYTDIVFPLDPRKTSSGKMISIRESKLSKNLLEEVLSRNMDKKSKIWRIMVICLGSGKLSSVMHEKLLEFASGSDWGGFIIGLRQFIDPCKPDWIGNYPDLTYNFQIALRNTYNDGWGKGDFITPNCFLYLVERLLIMLPHPRGYFFTTTSCFLEWLTCQESDSNQTESFFPGEQFTIKYITDVIVGWVHQLLHDSRSTAKWIRESNIDCKFYHPVLVLRLVMILCLLCLQTQLEIPFSRVCRLLNIPHVRSFLPREFCEAIESGKKGKTSSEVAVSRAFKVIDDPLVIVGLQESNREFVYPDAIFLDLKMFSSKQEIINTFFPSSTDTHDQSNSSNANNTVKSVVELPSEGDNREDGEGNMSHAFGMSESVMRTQDLNLKDCNPAMKVELETHETNQLSATGLHSVKDRAFPGMDRHFKFVDENSEEEKMNGDGDSSSNHRNIEFCEEIDLSNELEGDITECGRFVELRSGQSGEGNSNKTKGKKKAKKKGKKAKGSGRRK